MKFSEDDFNKVLEITAKVDSSLADLINKHMHSSPDMGEDIIYLTAIVNSLSYCLGRSLAELAAVSTHKDIQPIVIASGKIVNEGIVDFSKELKPISKYIN